MWKEGEKLSEKSEKSGCFGELQIKGGEKGGEIRARGSGVPQGGTAKLLLMLCRVYTILPFFFLLRGSQSPLLTESGSRAVHDKNTQSFFCVNTFSILIRKGDSNGRVMRSCYVYARHGGFKSSFASAHGVLRTASLYHFVRFKGQPKR